MPVTANLDKILDRQYEDMTLAEILDAPVAALAGITDAHAEELAKLKIRTVGDLGRNKYFRWAAAMADLQDGAGR